LKKSEQKRPRFMVEASEWRKISAARILGSAPPE
jgi:hypothetical protein